MKAIIQTSSVCFFHMRSFKQKPWKQIPTGFAKKRGTFWITNLRGKTFSLAHGGICWFSLRENWQATSVWSNEIQINKTWYAMSYIICHQLVYTIRVFTYLMCLWMTVHTVYMCVYIYIKYHVPLSRSEKNVSKFPMSFFVQPGNPCIDLHHMERDQLRKE